MAVLIVTDTIVVLCWKKSMHAGLFKTLFLLLLSVSVLGASSAEVMEIAGEKWMVWPDETQENYREKDWIERDDNRIFEVVKSRADRALALLEENSYIVIEDSHTLEYFLGSSASHLESMPESYQPYLLRAVYSNSNGGYRVGISNDNSSFVVYEQLGAITNVHRSALVVLLESEPKVIYVTIHSIM
ncbi:hypothetical protein [Gilvimarinus algae]|uniref:Uncharacterized protein n=1 Tax=Gilvimarinus algae TaxID=3058037 RepID=A0ABT8TH50_9GAMM|nr:hypothetical protein [Gilvimarinus sp. SDUM040014]MDO3381612.1 hypothetical protein [Gilvimarinus sp. SDUM040014]